MLTDYFSCYKLNNKSTPFQEEKNSQKLKDCKIFSVIKVLVYSNNGVNFLQNEKNQYFLTYAFQKKLALIILVQRLQSLTVKLMGKSIWYPFILCFSKH